MRDTHVPDEPFVDRLETTIVRELQQRRTAGPAFGWMPRWSLKAALAVAMLVMVSMGIGGAVVAMAYQARGDQHVDLLTASYRAQLEISQKRAELAMQQLRTAEQRVSLGIEPQDTLLDA